MVTFRAREPTQNPDGAPLSLTDPEAERNRVWRDRIAVAQCHVEQLHGSKGTAFTCSMSG